MKAQDVTVRFGAVTALADVSLQAPEGTVTAVVGGDGAGKTTLLEALVGLVAPDAGTIDTPDREQIGYMPSGAGSWGDLTVAENVAFVGGSYGLSGADLARRADLVLGAADLMSARDRLASQLSGGMRKKLGFCLAILHEPRLLILDEPSTGVDPVSRVELWRLTSTAAADGTAVVMATTYMDEAQRAGSVLLLDAGRELRYCPPDALIAQSPGEVVETASPTRRECAWRSGTVFREWWPDGAPQGQRPIMPSLDDVAVVAALQEQKVAS
jgi:ABC-2 type transport system ATP-binding protein